MRITIDIDETSGNAITTSTAAETMRMSGGPVRADLLARRTPDQAPRRHGQPEGHAISHAGSPPEVRHARNPLRTGAAIERHSAERGAHPASINAGPPAHLSRRSTGEERDSD
jgi:hypothetical protein